MPLLVLRFACDLVKIEQKKNEINKNIPNPTIYKIG